MAQVDAKVTHETEPARTRDERVVESVVIESTKAVEYRFKRVGECTDVWEFVEAVSANRGADTPKEALNENVIYAVLKKTPCVTIRDSNNDTLATIEYDEQFRSNDDVF